MSTSQLDIKQKKLIAIAGGVTEHLLYRGSKLSSFSQIGDYQVWRDRWGCSLS